MSVLKTSDPLALRLLFSDELYLVDDFDGQNDSAGQMVRTSEAAEVVDIPEAPKAPEMPGLAKVAKVPEVPEPSEQPVFNYLGENNKYFLLLVNQPGKVILNARDLESLTSILNAKKLEVRDVAIMNLSSYSAISFEMLKTFFVNTRLVLFGITTESLQLPVMPANKITTYEGVKILPTFSFEEMTADPSLKRIFWNEMKLL